MAASLDDLRRLRAEPPVLPDVPVTVMSGGRSSRLGRTRRTALIAARQARAEALPQGRHVRAERSGHYVPFIEPQLIADEILRIVDATRRS
jgi:pimeloyl-ACP methyl ester carboxylesterase